MRHSEYMFKGAFLGLLIFVALRSPSWDDLGTVILWMLGGFAIALVIGLVDQLRRRQPMGGPGTLVLFLLLEYPLLIHAGLVFGLFFGGRGLPVPLSPQPEWLELYCVVSGAILGFVLGEMRFVEKRYYRLAFTGLASVGAFAAAVYLAEEKELLATMDRRLLGLQILASLPFFYLLSFAGRSEETEAEMAMLCGAMGVGLWLIPFPVKKPEIGFILPMALYAGYALVVLPKLRIFKHVVQGYNYVKAGRTRGALLAFRRALELDPGNPSAREGLWWLHTQLQLSRLEREPETLSLLDFRMCLDRIKNLLASGQVPSDLQRSESGRLLDLVEHHRADWKPEVTYFRALLDTHDKNHDAAAEKLQYLLDPSNWDRTDASRDRALNDAWRLALQWHPSLRDRVGLPELREPGRRMEAIGAAERARQAEPNDPSIDELRDSLYADLAEEDYFTAAGDQIPTNFDHARCEQIGRNLVQNADTWQRGAEYLRIAGHGLPERGPGIFRTLADAAQRNGDMSLVHLALQRAVQAGIKAGVDSLLEDQKKDFYAALKRLADQAVGEGKFDDAIGHYAMYAQGEQDPKGTHRTLAELHEKKGDILAALKHCETALLYDSKDPALQTNKDRYYYSLEPDTLRQRLKDVETYFDTAYCKSRAKQVLDARNVEADSLDWANHLATLAQIAEPSSQSAKVLLARCLLRRGERDRALQLLEDVREEKPGSGDDEEAWYWTCQQLGRMYLDELNRPDLAISALEAFKEYHKSGADTIYHLGRAYEATGNRARAMQCYEQVTAYERHPRVYDAQSALARLKSES